VTTSAGYWTLRTTKSSITGNQLEIISALDTSIQHVGKDCKIQAV